MNSKAVAIILAVISLGLGAGLILRHTKAINEKKADVEVISDLTNKVETAKMKLKEQELVNIQLERQVADQEEKVKNYSNELVTVSTSLTKTQGDAKAAAEASKAELLKRDAQIANLESERDEHSKKMTELNSAIGKLEGQIVETHRRLEASEGDREFLLKELKRMQTEKAELERQFNDIALLREQVKRLRDELSVQRRLDWIRKGLFGDLLKGGERLNKGFKPAQPQQNYSLDVEINRDGSIKVTPPATNAPPATTNAPGAVRVPPGK